MPQSYSQIVDSWLQSKRDDPGRFGGMSLKDYATALQGTGVDDYSQGLGGESTVKNISIGIDKGIDWTGLPALTERYGRTVGDFFGAPDVGAEAGRALPRQLLEVGARAIPYAGPIIGPALAASGAYEKTGSGMESLLAGGMNLALPGIAQAGRSVAGKVVSPLTKNATGFIPTATERIAQLIGEQGAFEVVGKVPQIAGDLMHGQNPLESSLSPESLLHDVVGAAEYIPLTYKSFLKEGKFRSGIAADRAASAPKQLQSTEPVDRVPSIPNNTAPIPTVGPPNQTLALPGRAREIPGTWEGGVNVLPSNEPAIVLNPWDKLTQKDVSLPIPAVDFPQRFADAQIAHASNASPNEVLRLVGDIKTTPGIENDPYVVSLSARNIRDEIGRRVAAGDSPSSAAAQTIQGVLNTIRERAQIHGLLPYEGPISGAHGFDPSELGARAGHDPALVVNQMMEGHGDSTVGRAVAEGVLHQSLDSAAHEVDSGRSFRFYGKDVKLDMGRAKATIRYLQNNLAEFYARPGAEPININALKDAWRQAGVGLRPGENRRVVEKWANEHVPSMFGEMATEGFKSSVHGAAPEVQPTEASPIGQDEGVVPKGTKKAKKGRASAQEEVPQEPPAPTLNPRFETVSDLHLDQFIKTARERGSKDLAALEAEKAVREQTGTHFMQDEAGTDALKGKRFGQVEMDPETGMPKGFEPPTEYMPGARDIPQDKLFALSSLRSLTHVVNSLARTGRYSKERLDSVFELGRRAIANFDRFGKKAGIAVNLDPDLVAKEGAIGIMRYGSETQKPRGIELDPNQHGMKFIFTMLHEDSHMVEQMAKAGMLTPEESAIYNHALSTARIMSPDQRVQTHQALMTSLGMTDMTQSREAVLRGPDGPKEFVADVHAGLMHRVLDPALDEGIATRTSGIIAYLPRAIQESAAMMFRNLSAAMNAVKAVLMGHDSTTYAVRQLAKFDRLLSPLRSTPKETTAALDAMYKAIADTELVPIDGKDYVPTNMNGEHIESHQMQAEMAAGLQSDVPLPLNRDGAQISGFDKFVSNLYIQALRFPVLGKAVGILMQHRQVFNVMDNLVKDRLYERDAQGNPTRNPLGYLNDFHKVPENNAGFSKVARDQQILWKEEGREMSGDELRQAYIDAGVKDVDEAVKIRGRFREATLAVQKQMVDESVRDSALPTALMIMRKGGMDPSKTDAIATQLVQALWANNPIEAGNIALSLHLDAAELNAINESAQRMKPIHDALVAKIANPSYMTEQRYGKFMSMWKDKDSGERGSMGFDTRSAAEAFGAQMAREGHSDVSVGTKANYNPQAEVLPESVLNTLNNAAQGRAAEVERILGADHPDIDIIKGMLFMGDSIQNAMVQQRMAPFMKNREFKPGREYLDMLDNQLRFFTGSSYGLAKRLTQRQANLIRVDPDFNADPRLRDRALGAIKNELSPDSSLLRGLMTAISTNTIVMNPSSAIVSGIDHIIKLPAYLQAHFGAGLRESFYQMAGGMKDAAKYVLKRGGLDPAVEAFLKEAEYRKVIGYGLFDPEMGNGDISAINARRFSADHSVAYNKLNEWTSSPWAYYQKVGQSMFRVSDQINQTATAVAAFKMSRVKYPELSLEDHYQNAFKAINVVASPGGRGARPEGLANIPAAGALLALQNYALANTAFAAHLIRSSGLKTPEGRQATRAALTLLGTMVGVAGVTGLPGVGPAIGLLDDTFKELRLKGRLREMLAGFGNGDQELGGMIADVGLKGLPSVLPGFQSVDVSSRVGTGGVLGLNEETGWSAEDFFGPAGSIASSWKQALGYVSEGDYRKAGITVLPTGLRNVAKTIVEGNMALDAKGNAVAPLSTSDQIMRSVGFRPSVIAQAADQKALVRQSNEAAAAKLGVFVEQQSRANLEGRQSDVATDVDRFVADNPDYTRVQVLQAIAKHSMEKLIPPNAIATSGHGAEVATSFRPSMQQTPTALDRAMMLQQQSSLLGLPSLVNLQRPAMEDAMRLPEESTYQYGIRQRLLRGR